MLQRVEVGDPHRVRRDGPGARATARPNPDSLPLGPVDEVGDDQEVPGEALGQNDLGLELRPSPGSVRHASRVALPEPPLDLLDEPGVLALPRRARVARHVGAVALAEGHLAPLGDGQGVVAGLRQLGEQRAHLGRGLQVVAVTLELEPAGIGHRRGGLYAEQHLVRGGIGLVGVVQVVGRHQRQLELAGDLHQLGPGSVLDSQAVVHQLHEVVAGAEEVAELRGTGQRLVVPAEAEQRLHLAARAAGGGDQTLGVGREQLAVHPRLVEVPLQRGQRTQPEQVVHPGGALRPHRQVGVRAASGDVVAAPVPPADPLAFGAMGLRGQVRLGADDRLDPGGLRRLVELIGPEGVAVVGDRDRRHAHLRAPGEQVGDPGGAVQHRVLRVHMQVDEGVAPRSGASRHARTTSKPGTRCCSGRWYRGEASRRTTVIAPTDQSSVRRTSDRFACAHGHE